MLFKRIIGGKSVLNTEVKSKYPDKCSRRKSECAGKGCREHSTILEEIMKKVLLGIVLWAGLPLNLIGSTDIRGIHSQPMHDFPFPSRNMLDWLPSVSPRDTNKTLEVSKFSVDLIRSLEIIFKASNIVPASGSTAKGLSIQGNASDDAMRLGKSSYTITMASINLVYSTCGRYGFSTDECARFVGTLSLRDTEFGGECAALERSTCPNKMPLKYRTFDGSCNNPVRSSWGQSLTGYKRLLHPTYADGIQGPRRAVGSKPLPSARLVSTKITNTLDKPEEKRTITLAVWSQFIYHDLVHTPIQKTFHTKLPIRCCDDDGLGWPLSPRFTHPSCMHIDVPADDVYYKGKRFYCMEHTRSLTTYRGDCTFGAAEQMNQVTHFLDGSQIYGSNDKDAAALREVTGGLLKTSSIDDLPLSANSADKCLGDDDACFNAGDVRVNMYPWLTSLHALWVREHNRIAVSLAALNPGWNSDRLYHEARRIVVAELQHITYKHWLTALTGKAFQELYDTSDISYNSEVDPTVSNSFATAGFHFIYSLLDQDITLVDENSTVTSHRLADHYFKPALVAQQKGVEKIVRGMIAQNSQSMDFNYDHDLRDRWLGSLDVLAIDIQRGRDHGLPGYIQFRSHCGLSHVQSFQNLSDVMTQETIDKLADVYECPADIDLVVGLMAETHLPNSLLGPTATCLIKEQLWRTRIGDRYFYTHTGEDGSFSNRQLTELKGTSLARIICDNTGVSGVQKDVFLAASKSNPVLPCDQITRLNLKAWQDPSPQPDVLSRTKNGSNTVLSGS